MKVQKMSEAPDRAARLSDTSRVETFSDGVFAIVITLLVLDLRPPAVPPGQLLAALLEQWPTYLAFVTSFLYVGVVWLNHHAAFDRIRRIDRGLHWANLGILFTTTLLPFPTAVISKAIRSDNPADARTAVGLYALIGVLLCASWLVFFRYLSRHPRLFEHDIEARFFERECIRGWAGVILYATAGVLGYALTPAVALAIFLAVPIFYAFTSHGLLYELPVIVHPVARRS
jgi:uncharacterized membrane protein